MRRRFVWCVSLAVALMVVAGCSDSEPESAATTTTVAETVTTTTTVAETSTTTTSAPETTTSAAPATTTTSTLPPVPGGVDVTIETAIIIGAANWAGTFEATGPAVDEGIMCPAGSVELQMATEDLATYRVDTPFTCDDGTGTFYVHYDLELVIDGDAYNEVGTWTVGIGTDAYEMLIGNGTDSTTGPAAGPFLSIMEGQVAISDG